MGRILLAGLLGGVAMFIWTSLAHTVLPLGQMGIQEIPDDAPVIATLQGALGDRDGLYIFPGSGNGAKSENAASRETMEARTAKEASGLLVYHPPGRDTAMGPYIGKELTLEIFQALILAWLIATSTASGLGGRTLAAAAVGLVVAFATNGSNRIWYGFPTDFTYAAILIQVVGYTVAGAVIAVILGMKRRTAASG
ncbi:MAG TPA: hypothetical protein PLO65_00730 [Caulobacter sp.]|nr:hypothetical protein [Caulobacter sp.]